MSHKFFFLTPRDLVEAQSAFTALAEQLRSLLPADADIQHIGATSIPGCLTKGDLDLCVRVRQEDFIACDAALAKRFIRNSGSYRGNDFSAFHAEDAGIQLVVIGSECDMFVIFRDLLNTKPKLLNDYNTLKQRYHGKPMDQYRAAKSAFIKLALSSVDEIFVQ